MVEGAADEGWTLRRRGYPADTTRIGRPRTRNRRPWSALVGRGKGRWESLTALCLRRLASTPLTTPHLHLRQDHQQLLPCRLETRRRRPLPIPAVESPTTSSPSEPSTPLLRAPHATRERQRQRVYLKNFPSDPTAVPDSRQVAQDTARSPCYVQDLKGGKLGSGDSSPLCLRVGVMWRGAGGRGA